jgi:apolipoprotein D and lipocalin family protein
MRNSIIFITLILSVAISQQKFEPVKEVNLKAYEGDWWEAAYTPIIDKTFEKNGFCVKANYQIIEGGVKVHNVLRKGSPTGPIGEITGKAVPYDKDV